MRDENPVILVAAVSAEEAEGPEPPLRKSGWRPIRVADAVAAARRLDAAAAGPAVLVIDAGLLAMPHDPQWRRLREERPELGVVVRRLAPRASPVPKPAGRVFEVHPDDREALCAAVRRLVSRPAAARTEGLGRQPGARAP